MAAYFLIVLYSINVFITFSLSQLGMVRHWWAKRGEVADWKRKISVNGVGFLLTTFILVTLSVIKFFEGGWITLVVTGLLVAVAVLIKRHYNQTALDCCGSPTRYSSEASLSFAMRRSSPGSCTTTPYSLCSGASTSRACRC
jgi:K+ transporter